MQAMRRGLRNLGRNPIRSVLVVLILALGIGIWVSLLEAARGVRERVGQLGAEVGNLIEVRAKGATGMGVGAQALPETFFEPARRVPHVSRVEPYLFQRTTDPARPIAQSVFVGMQPGATPRVASHGEVGKPTLVAGRFLQPEDVGRQVAVVGKLFADQYDLEVGDTLLLPPRRIAPQDRGSADAEIRPLRLEVVGIFESGFAFGDSQVFLPLDVAQWGFGQPGRASHVFVTVDSVRNVDQVERDLRLAFAGRADIISGQDQARRFADTLAILGGNATLGAGLALAVAGLLVAFVMALVSRERTREIGVLKALGATNGEVAGQFVGEALGLSSMAGLLGTVLYVLAGPALTKLLLPPVATAAAQALHGATDPLSVVGVRAAASVSFEGVVLGAGVALVVAILGSLYPVRRAVGLRPAEAIRHE